MKWAVVLLITANIAFFYWLQSAGPSRIQDVQKGRLPRIAEIQLVDQMDQAGRPPDSQSPDEPSASDQSAALSRQCFGVGWFSKEAEAREFARRLVGERSAIEGFAIRERVEVLPDFHWVLIPPLESREKALERYRELAARGIEVYVVRSGKNENAISLGLFRSQRSAEQLLTRRQSENIDATLANFPRNRISYALVFGGAPGALELSGGDLSAESGGELQLIEISDCEGVATTEKNP